MSIQPKDPGVDVDSFMVAGHEGIESIRRSLNERKAMTKDAKSTCANCGKHNEGKLKQCSVCRSARYCSRECQVDHYKAHRKSCTSFSEPPITEIFRIDNPHECPVFAKGHDSRGPIGLWLTCAGSISVSLDRLIDSRPAFHGTTRTDPDEYAQKMKEYPNAGSSDLLTLRVLVQNRNRTTPIMVLGFEASLITSPDGLYYFQQWEQPKDEFVDMVVDGHPVRCVGVIKDPWGLRRVAVVNINGQALDEGPPKTGSSSRSKNPHLKKILDPKAGIVLLDCGDFAVLELQFRGGDGIKYSAQYDTFQCLQSFRLPCAATSSIQTAMLKTMMARLPGASSPDDVFIINSPFDRKTIDDYYAEYIRGGPDAHIKVHYGEARSQMVQEGDKAISSMVQSIIRELKQSPGAVEEMKTRMQAMGQGHLVQLLED